MRLAGFEPAQVQAIRKYSVHQFILHLEQYIKEHSREPETFTHNDDE